MMIRKAKITEAKDIKRIIDIHSEKKIILPRSLDEIYINIRDFTVCIVDEQVVGICALAIFTEEYAEIRTLAVLDKYRKMKIGEFLVKSCMAEAHEYDIKNLFALTYIPEYFKKLQFISVPKDNLPHKIWRDCVSCEHFYHCNEEAMIYHL